MKQFLFDLWCQKSDVFTKVKRPESIKMDIEELRKSEWSNKFEELMKNRLLVGAFRYGKIHDSSKLNYDRMLSIIERAKLYEENGNDELLVDIANLALVEFEIGKHLKKHFKSIDDGNHVSIK